MSALDVVRDATEKLDKAGVPEPVASAEVLLSELLDVRRGELAFFKEPFSEEQASRFGAWILRRLNREPTQRILSRAYFRNLKLKLNDYTLIPRPDTESVVEAALEIVDRRGGGSKVLDLGTGSGAVAISIAQERPACEVHATDVSETALRAARENASLAGVTVQFHQADVVSGLSELEGEVEVLVSNPPYVKSGDLAFLQPEVRDWDPRGALDGGVDGLSFYRRIFAETPPLLADGAEVVLEVGDGQEKAIFDLGRDAGFMPFGAYPDLTGTSRAVLLQRERGA